MSVSNNISLRHILPFVGALPFVAGNILLGVAIDSIPNLGSVQHLINTYGVVIASFMAGVHWGQHLSFSNFLSPALALTSNFVTLAVWFSYLLIDPRYLFIALSLAFVTLIFIDTYLCYKKHITERYLKTRLLVTLIVIANLLITGVLAW